MKIIAFIMALTLTGMAFTPCTDTSSCDDHVHDSSNPHSEDHEDTCTPLCVCSCCGISITFSEIIPFSEPAQEAISTASHFYKSDYSYSFISSVWHPPSQF